MANVFDAFRGDFDIVRVIKSRMKVIWKVYKDMKIESKEWEENSENI